MNKNQALAFFLENALVTKKERYLGFAAKLKTRRKFLNSIRHELEECLDTSKRVRSLSKDILASPGYLFEPDNNFGEEILCLGDACDSQNESFLVVSADGRHAIHGPETLIDSRAFYIL